MAGISSKALNFGGAENKKKFTSQILDDDLGLNWYQMKYRNMDPQIGRFWQVDPLATKYVYNSTYAYAENDIIRAIDIEGLEKLIVTTTHLNHHASPNNISLDRKQVLKGSSNTNYSQTNVIPQKMMSINWINPRQSSQEAVDNADYITSVSETKSTTSSQVQVVNGQGKVLVTTTNSTITTVNLDPLAKDGIKSIQQTTSTSTTSQKVVSDNPNDNSVTVSTNPSDVQTVNSQPQTQDIPVTDRLSSTLSQVSPGLESQTLDATKENQDKLNNTANQIGDGMQEATKPNA